MSSETLKDNTTLEYKGVKAVLDRALQSYEKLPMLEIVFERFVRLLNTLLRNLTSESTEIEITNFSSLRFSSYQKEYSGENGVIGLFKAIEWDNLALIAIDNQLVVNLIDILFGGKKHHGSHNLNARTRSITYIEQKLVQQIMEMILAELALAFEAIAPATFAFERLESNTNFATIARPGDAVILLQLSVKLDDRSGRIDLVIPYATIEPIKPLLQQVFLGDKFGIDASWEAKMLDNVQQIDMPLEAIIAKEYMPISKVLKLKVGETVVLNHKKDQDISVFCGDIELFKAQIGKAEDQVAVHITEIMVGED